MIIDGTDLILGRAAAFAAKNALLGEDVQIINCEEMVITGKRKSILDEYQRMKRMGVPSKGPFLPKRPDMLVKRVIRGMLPYKQFKGKMALKRVMCHIGNRKVLKGDSQVSKLASVDKVPNLKYIKLKEVSKELGWLRK